MIIGILAIRVKETMHSDLHWSAPWLPARVKKNAITGDGMPRVDRLVIGIFGRVNAGKSTLMNLLAQHEASIVDPQPGTTADIKSIVMEIHGLGPVRLLDTAGLDESSGLGEKKRRKTLAALEEVDVALLVIDPVQAVRSRTLEVEELVGNLSRRHGRALGIVFNLREDAGLALEAEKATLAEALEFCRTALPDRTEVPSLTADLSLAASMRPVVDFVSSLRPGESRQTALLPFVEPGRAVILHIPMDEETPSGRLLRPQEMVMEYLLRMMVPVGLYRVDLKLGRSSSKGLRAMEEKKFRDFLSAFDSNGGVQLVITDSQAIDLMSSWVPPGIPLTTFSIMMINQTTGGDLALFARGTQALDSLRSGDRVLIAEACNHDRMAEDIGTEQIPNKLSRKVPGLAIDHSFGREFPSPEELARYRVVIHCGGCMISRQAAAARVHRLHEAGVPVTNYGLVLSWIEGPEVLGRVLAPWL